MEEVQTTEGRLERLGVKVTTETFAGGKSETIYYIPLVENKPTNEIGEELMQIGANQGFHFSVMLKNNSGGSIWIPESLLMKSGDRQGLLPPDNAAEALETAINTHNWESAFKDGIVSAEVQISNL